MAGRAAEGTVRDGIPATPSDRGMRSRRCNYCGIDHPVGELSDEHIIPRFLLNESYVLPDVCKRVNNFIACSFETPVRQDGPLRNVVVYFDPAARGKRIHMGQVETDDGGTADVWFEDGREHLVPRPTYLETDELRVSAERPDGSVVSTLTRVPFKFVVGAHGTKDATTKGFRRQLAQS